jgi:hypothetical protein
LRFSAGRWIAQGDFQISAFPTDSGLPGEPGLHAGQDRLRIVLSGERQMRIVAAGRRDRKLLFSFRQMFPVQISVGLFKRLHASHPQASQ